MEENRNYIQNSAQEDQAAVFDRVWRRVMAGGETSCPITWDAPAEEAVSPEPAPALKAALPALTTGDHPKEDFPGPGLVLGEESLDWTPLLQTLIRQALGDWKEYQALARRTGGLPGRSLAALAGEKKRHAKRLSAACFLISGVRYWPEGGGGPVPTAYLGTLRRRFLLEQERMAACLAGAEGCADPCLAQLLLELGRECWDHACRVRTLVEQA